MRVEMGRRDGKRGENELSWEGIEELGVMLAIVEVVEKGLSCGFWQ